MRPKIRSRLALFVMVIGGIALLGYWVGRPELSRTASSPSGTAGKSGTVDIDQARDRGAEVGEQAAAATARVHDTMAEAVITTKIKAKMALDDSIKARAIDVSTSGHTVTLSGTVRSVAEGDRAMSLARETAGVTHVIDNLFVQQAHQVLSDRAQIGRELANSSASSGT
jgi:hyperosmotically inducible protein